MDAMSGATATVRRRRFLNPEAVSIFSIWHLAHVPADRGLTDVDGLVFRNRRLEGLVEHRTGGYVGTPADNRSLDAVRRLAEHLGLGLSLVDGWRDGIVDTRFAVWLAYQMRPAPRLLAVFETPGNLSPVTRKAVAVPTEATVSLAAHCAAFEVPYRTVEVRPDGVPARIPDVQWLVALPRLAALR